MNNKVSCSKRIQQALDLRNMKQADVCKITGIGKSAMSQYIKGTFEPKQDRIYLISKALNVSEAWLMGYDVPIERETQGATPQSIDPSQISEPYLRFAKEAQEAGATIEDLELILRTIKVVKKDTKDGTK